MQVVFVPFHEDVLEAMLIRDNDNHVIYIVCKRISENLGLEWSGQYQVLRDHELLAAHLLNVDIYTEAGKHSALCLPLKYLPYWLAGIQTKRVNPEIRQKLLHYQEECVDVLARYFLGDGVVVNQDERVFSNLDLLKGMVTELERQDAINKSQDKHLLDHDDDIEYLSINKADKMELAMLKAKMEADKRRRQEHAIKEFSQDVKLWVWEKAQGRCMRCRRRLIPEARRGSDERPQYDHIIPKTCGGKGLITNCQLLCSACNRQKSGCVGPCKNNHSDYRPLDIVYEAEQILLKKANGGQPHDDQLGWSF